MAKLNRRSFLQKTALAGAALSLPNLTNAEDQSQTAFRTSNSPLRTRIRLGFIGVGLRGQDHVDLALRRDVMAGHGGMDFFAFHHFVECAKRNIAPQIDVYDAATWLAITPLSEASIATGSSPQAFPDFTRGRWTERKADFAFDAEF